MSEPRTLPTWFRMPSVSEVLAIAGLVWGAASLAGNIRTSQTVLHSTVETQAELIKTLSALVTRVEVMDTRLRMLEENKARTR